MDDDDYCAFLKRSLKIVEGLLENWDHVSIEELRARIQFFQTALATQIAHHCGVDEK